MDVYCICGSEVVVEVGKVREESMCRGKRWRHGKGGGCRED